MNTNTDLASGYAADRIREFIRVADQERTARAARSTDSVEAAPQSETDSTSRRSGRGNGRTTATSNVRHPARRWRLRPLNSYQNWLAAGRL